MENRSDAKKDIGDCFGFTLVELIVVIAILGVISTLVILSYVSYRKNTENKVNAATTQAYIDALNLYKLENNNYPLFPEGYACLGEGYDITGDGTKKCQISPGGPNYPAYIQEVTSFNNALKPYFPGNALPKPNNFLLTITPTWKSSGPFYIGDIASVNTLLDGVRHPWFVHYFQEGSNARCPVGPVATLSVNGNPQQYSSTPPPQGYTFSWGSIVQCSIALPAIPATP
jgi:prepilin-type N-terminal cleavage/methylation domain-containing protein